MATRTAEAVWEGNLMEGAGVMRFGSGAFEGRYSYSSRFEEGPGTNPEELIAAAHAGCFSMAFSADLANAGFTPTRVTTRADGTIEKVDGKNTISRIHLNTDAEVPGIDGRRSRKSPKGRRRAARCRAPRAGQISRHRQTW
jgi:osmotically inducible protein OsmC